MDRDIPLVPTLIFLVFILNAIYSYTSRIEALSPTPVQQVVQDSEGTIWALFGHSLIDLSDTKPNRTFSQHGFVNHVGQIIPLASGHWILNIGAQGQYVKKALERSTLEDNAEHQGSGSLLKCSSDLTQCVAWGEAELQFERAFDGVELSDGRILIVKAEQKRIFLLNSAGFILSEVQGEELWFGVNQTSTGIWFGLNTDRRELVELNIDKNTITVANMPFDFMNLNGDVDKITNPSKTVEYNGTFWTLDFVAIDNERSKLENAERLLEMTPSLLSIDISSNTVRRFPYDLRADAEIERIDDAIYFSDFGKYEIKRFDLASKTLDLSGGKNLYDAFQEDEKRVKEEKESLYKSLSINGLAAFLALIWLIVKSTPIKQKEQPSVPSDDVINYDGLEPSVDKELLYVAGMFSKKKPTMLEAKVLAPFKKVDDVYVYYPKGVFAKGRIVPDTKTLVSLYKWGENSQRSVKKWLLLPILMVYASTMILVYSRMTGLILLMLSLLGLLCGALFAIIHANQRQKIIKNLLIHDSRLTMSDVIERTAQIMPFWAPWLFVFMGVFMSLFTCYLFYINTDNLNDGAIKTAFIFIPFGAILIFFGIKLRSVKNKLES